MRNEKLRYTPPNDLNDPFESYPFVESIIPIDSIGSILSEQEIDDCFSREYLVPAVEKELNDQGFGEMLSPNEIEALVDLLVKDGTVHSLRAPVMDVMKSFLNLEGPDYRSIISDQMKKKFSQMFGILCLSEKPDIALMWSHYSQAHRGFVIGFNTEHSHFRLRENHFVPSRFERVDYVQGRPKVKFYDPLQGEEQMEALIRGFFLKVTNGSMKESGE